jgi:glycosyltransferase involved in cell wall biosynthesis
MTENSKASDLYYNEASAIFTSTPPPPLSNTKSNSGFGNIYQVCENQQTEKYIPKREKQDFISAGFDGVLFDKTLPDFKKEYKFSIITPTYNRASYLPFLYKSLRKQSETDFEWIIIDDGSTDETGNIVSEFEKTFDIRYIFQENAGRPSAVNMGINGAKGRLIIILDDKDYLLQNSLRIIWSYYDAETNLFRKKCKALTGYYYERTSGAILGDYIRHNLASDFFSLAYRTGKFGDKLHVFCADIAKEYPYPNLPDEKFIETAFVFNRMAARGYKVLCINAVLANKEYLQGGMTKNVEKLHLANPKGMELYFNEASAVNVRPYWNIRLSAIYIKFAKINKRKNVFRNAKNKAAFPFGLAVYYLTVIYKCITRKRKK